MRIRDFINQTYDSGDDDHTCERCQRIEVICKKLPKDDAHYLSELYDYLQALEFEFEEIIRQEGENE